MTKNQQKIESLCYPYKHWAEVLFSAKGNRGNREIHNIPNGFLLSPFSPLFILLSAKFLLFSVTFSKINTLAQAQWRLHWNFFLCYLLYSNQRKPNDSGGNTENSLSVTLLSIKIK
jgi:hypothetical protein